MSNPLQGVGQVGGGLPLQRPGGAPPRGPGGLPPGGPGGVGGAGAEGAQGASFKDTFTKALGDVQGLQDDAGDAVQAFLRGDPVELHDVMAAVEEAGLALEMLIEVRNRFIEAYRTVANMQT